MKSFGLKLLCLLTPLAFAVDCTPARAILNYNIYESLGDLVVETDGSLNLSSPIPQLAGCVSGALNPTFGSICTGPASSASSLPAYSITGPISFPGIGGGIITFVLSGRSTILSAKPSFFPFPPFTIPAFFAIDSTYVSGDPIISRATFSGKTLADFGWTPTTGLLGTWTLTGTADTINVRVFNPVPGPLPLLGVGAVFGISRRLRQRIRQR